MTDHTHDREMLRRLIGIDHKTDSMQDSLAWIVRANAPGLKEELLKEFGKSERRAQVYLAMNGSRTVNEIAAHLGMKRPNVSSEIGKLRSLRLVDIIESETRGTLYSKKFFDKIVGLSDSLMALHKLDKNGNKM